MRRRLVVLSLAAALFVTLDRPETVDAQAPPTITVNVAASRRAIDSRIYGVNFATTAQLQALNVSLNRWGGNNTSRHNWQANGDNRGADWYFESVPYASATPGAEFDSFVSTTRAGSAEPMATIPIIGWVAKLGTGRSKLASFSIAKYGPQTGSDAQWFPDAGNGISATTGEEITGNDPNDANVLKDSTFQQQWVQHLVGRWGAAASGGVRYYILDNEHSIWYATHRDVRPTGPRMREIRDLFFDYGAKIKAADPGALIVGPEEWGWSAYFHSGYDHQFGGGEDRQLNGGWDYLPWLLNQLRQHEVSTGQKVLDVFTVHYYPQGGEFSSSTSTAMQERRNRSTRSLWDPNYVDETWISDRVRLVPRLKGWVSSYYPELPIGITEYSWGADTHINGATAQADVLGIFGREGLDLATRWVTPATASVTFKSFQMYRNYDGNRSTFGDVSVSATSSLNPDNTAVFAAQRSTDGALTIMVVNKALSGATTASMSLAGFTAGGSAQVYQLTSTNSIRRQADVGVSGGTLPVSVPAQSITLYVVPSASGPSLSIGDGTVTEGSSGSTNATFTVSLSQASSGTVTVGYATAGGTATAGSDYVSTSGTLTFAVGETVKAVTVAVKGDTAVELDETFYVALSSPTGATLADGQGTGTIVNDDTAASTLSIGDVTVTEGSSGTTNAIFTVTLSPAAAQVVSLNYATANGTATAGSDYSAASGSLSFPAGQTTRAITVAVAGDTMVEPDETFLVNLSGAVGATLADAQATGTIANDDAASGVPVAWVNAAGVTVSGSSLTKTAATGWGNGGAASSQFLAAGEGAVQVTATTTTGARMFGLSRGSTTSSYPEIDFAFYLVKGGNLRVFENGVNRGVVATYTASDTLRVAVESGGVKYLRNGVVLYTSAVAPRYPLIADTALYERGATLNDARLFGTWAPMPAASVPVVWSSVVGATVSGSSLTKTAVIGWGNAGAVSSLSLPSGDGAVEITAAETSRRRMFGLGNGSITSSYPEIDYALYLMQDGSVRIYENGAYRGAFGTYAAGDKLRVAVQSGVVRYFRNGVLLYESTVAPIYPLLVDTALYDPGASVGDGRLAGAWQ